MMFDVDRLNEALARKVFWRASEGRIEIAEAEFDVMIEALDMVAAGQPLWWCETHETQRDDDFPEDQCWRKSTQEDGPEQLPCRMVEGWWSPTGGDE